MMTLPKMTRKDQGAILILSLWAVAFLSAFAICVGMLAHSRIQIASRVEKRNQLATLGLSSVAWVQGKVHQYNKDLKMLPGLRKESLHNNPRDFKEVKLASGVFDISYRFYDWDAGGFKTRFGIVDEESKIDINTVDVEVLDRLFQVVLKLSGENSLSLAQAIIDWREFGEGEMYGFFSDDYYEKLEFPYRPKNKKFELLEELLLVRDINSERYEVMKDYLTVNNPGPVNINTASWPALIAVGCSSLLATKIYKGRAGLDGVEGTADDFIFTQLPPFEIMRDKMGLNYDEYYALTGIFNIRLLDAQSNTYRVESVAYHGGERHQVACVFDAHSGGIFYWREEGIGKDADSTGLSR